MYRSSTLSIFNLILSTFKVIFKNLNRNIFFDVLKEINYQPILQIHTKGRIIIILSLLSKTRILLYSKKEHYNVIEKWKGNLLHHRRQNVL